MKPDILIKSPARRRTFSGTAHFAGRAGGKNNREVEMKWPDRFLIRLLACTGLVLLATSCAPLDRRTPSSSAILPDTLTNSLLLKFVRIPAGEFIAGSPDSEPERSTNEVQHLVKITKPFRLAATHVTAGQFATFVQASGYQTLAEKQGWACGAWNVSKKKWDQLAAGSWKNPGFPQSPDHPVVCVTWNDATAFCDWLSAKEGRKYRLPTEAEWEYACRAGATTAYPWGNRPDDGKGWANGSDQTAAGRFPLFPAFNWSDGYVFTSPVAFFRPNAWGLHDMIGNALQWCGDWFGDYPAETVEDPKGAAEGRERVLRGGSFVYGPRHCRCAFRGRNSPDFQNFYVGFRVALEIDPPERTSHDPAPRP